MAPEHEGTAVRREGQDLHWGGCNLTHLARAHGTPLFVVNTGRLRETYRQLAQVFRDSGLRARVFYSFKTNPVPVVLETLTGLGCGAEVISEFDLFLARRLNVEGGRIIVNGPVKSDGLLREAVRLRVALINAESVEEIETLARLAAEAEAEVNVGLRINPALARPRWDFAVSSGARRSHMGFRMGGAEFERALAALGREPRLRLRGLHFHLGSGIARSKPYREALRRILAVWADLWERGFRPEVLDIGGGFTTAAVKPASPWDAARVLLRGRSLRPPRSAAPLAMVAEVARACARQVHRFAAAGGIPVPQVYVEPGRALSATSQILLLTVKRVIHGRGRATYAVCDGGAMSLSPLLLAEYHGIEVVNKAGAGPTRACTVVGSLPTALDVVAFRRRLPVLSAGDVLAVLDVGAYFTALGNTFAGPRPAIVVVEDGRAVFARRRETHEDLIARDVGMRIGDCGLQSHVTEDRDCDA